MIRWRRPTRALPDDADAIFARHLGEWRFLDDDERDRLRADAATLVASKRWEAARGFELTDGMCALIAAHAALVVLGLDVQHYRHVKAIVVHPTTMTQATPRPGPVAGLMTDEPVHLDGEAHDREGPVVLAWDVVRRDGEHRGNGLNVVVHEFAHKLDMLDGMIDGTPPMADRAQHQRWVDVCGAEYRRLRTGLGDGLLRDYAATDPGEFFAVVAESFFDRPVMLAELKPELYGVLREYFGQDPAARHRARQP
jgi:Mlc titration factor MtfA (ptsG expression regulator)